MNTIKLPNGTTLEVVTYDTSSHIPEIGQEVTIDGCRADGANGTWIISEVTPRKGGVDMKLKKKMKTEYVIQYKTWGDWRDVGGDAAFESLAEAKAGLEGLKDQRLWMFRIVKRTEEVVEGDERHRSA